MALLSRFLQPSMLVNSPSLEFFYRHTPNRWIYNEKQRALVLVRFDS